jgi:RNA polymerase sigma-70 factor (ECF subfamily)
VAEETVTLTPERVLREYVARIYNLARRLLSNESDVEDVTQEVLLQVVRKLDTFRGEAELTSWLHRVTVNAALLHRRKQARQLARQAEVSPEYIADEARPPGGTPPGALRPDRLAQDAERRCLIERAIARLPKLYRDVFVLAEVEGLPERDIALRLGVLLPTVKSRLHRARLLLRDALAAYDPMAP